VVKTNWARKGNYGIRNKGYNSLKEGAKIRAPRLFFPPKPFKPRLNLVKILP